MAGHVEKDTLGRLAGRADSALEAITNRANVIWWTEVEQGTRVDTDGMSAEGRITLEEVITAVMYCRG